MMLCLCNEYCFACSITVIGPLVAILAGLVTVCTIGGLRGIRWKLDPEGILEPRLLCRVGKSSQEGTEASAVVPGTLGQIPVPQYWQNSKSSLRVSLFNTLENKECALACPDLFCL